MPNKSGSYDEVAQEYLESFQASFNDFADDLERLRQMQFTHDNIVDDNVWPTISKIPLAEAWATTEAAVGPAMEFLFPPSPFINLIPSEDIDQDALEKVEWALHLTLVYKMRLRMAMLKSVKDSFKVSLGYGIVESTFITPPSPFEIIAGGNRTTQMGDGRPVRVPRFRYISPGKILPDSQGGTDFNGVDPTPRSYFLDLYPEWQFRALYDNQPDNGEEFPLQGDPEAIIAECRSQGFGGQTGFSEFAEDMMGRRNRALGGGGSAKQLPVTVPIMKCYDVDRGRHVWMFWGTNPQTIYKADNFAAKRSPLVKFDPWQDADRWYPMSQPEADMSLTWAKNVWFNAMYDIMTWAVKRPLLYDSENLDRPPQFGPQGAIGIPGDVRQTARFMDPPGIDQGTFGMGDVIDAQRSQTTGQRDLTQKNFARGGSQAFESLLNSSTGRDRLRYSILQMGGLESVVRQVLLIFQTQGQEMDLRFQRPTFSAESRRKRIEHFTVTEDELMHSYDIVLDLDEKYRRSMTDKQFDLQVYDRLVQSPYVRQDEVPKLILTDEFRQQRIMLPREEIEAKQKASEEAAMEGQRVGLAKAQAGAAQIPEVAGRLEGGAV